MLLSHLLVLVLLHSSPSRTHFPSLGSALPHLLDVPLCPFPRNPLPTGAPGLSPLLLALYIFLQYPLFPLDWGRTMSLLLVSITHLLSILTSPKRFSSWVCWDKPVIPTLKRLRDDREFEVSLNDIKKFLSPNKNKMPLKINKYLWGQDRRSEYSGDCSLLLYLLNTFLAEGLVLSCRDCEVLD